MSLWQKITKRWRSTSPGTSGPTAGPTAGRLFLEWALRTTPEPKTAFEYARQRERRWRRAFAATMVVLALLLAANSVFGEIHPASPWGLGYGIAAAVLLVLVMLLGARRRAMGIATRLGLGSARAWLLMHLWLGLTFGVLVLMHAAFRWPVGTVTVWAFVLSGWTVATGGLGLLLQRWIPIALSRGVETEVLYDRIPEHRVAVAARADVVAARCPDVVQDLHRRKMADSLARLAPHPVYFLDIAGGIQTRLESLRYLRAFVSADHQEDVTELERLYRAKFELDAHFTLQRALRWWLYAHVPFAFLLLAFVTVHVATVLYY